MATPDQVQAQLDTDTSGRHAKILNSFEGATKTGYFVNGDLDAAGCAQPVECNTADTAAQQATAILNGLKLG